MQKVTILSILLMFTISTHAQWWGSSKTVKGNGVLKTEKRKVGDYDAISSGGFFDVILVKGKEGVITLTAEENILEHIIIEVKGNNLQIKTEKGYNIKTRKGVKITVPVTDIDEVSLGGSGNITSKTTIKAESLKLNLGGSGNIDLDIDSSSLNASIGGSGSIKLSGNSGNAKTSIAGSGSIKAYDLIVKTLKANIAGSGNIKATVKDEINAVVAGSGSIYYKGNPDKIKSKSLGSGSVSKQ